MVAKPMAPIPTNVTAPTLSLLRLLEDLDLCLVEVIDGLADLASTHTLEPAILSPFFDLSLKVLEHEYPQAKGRVRVDSRVNYWA